MNLRFLLKNYRHWIRRAFYRGCGGRIQIGKFTYGAPLVRWWGEPANLSIGKYCSIADDVQIFLGGNHRIDWISTYPFSILGQWSQAARIEGHPSTRGDVTIGNDVWLGAGCVILSGVTIGHGAVIGCRAVVSRDIPDYAVAVGNPAKVVRFRFDPGQVQRLVKSAWWDWDPDTIRQHLGLLLSSRVDAFLAVAEPE